MSARIVGPITYNAEDRMTFDEWRNRFPDIAVSWTDDGLYHVRAMVIGSVARGSLWHLADYHVVGVSCAGISLAPKAIVD